MYTNDSNSPHYARPYFQHTEVNTNKTSPKVRKKATRKAYE